MGESNSNPVSSEKYQYTHRGRAIKSCLECRRRKMRCSRSQPCQNCSRFSRACIYLPYPDWPSSPFPGGQDGSSSQSNKKHEDQTHAPSSTAPQTSRDQRSPLNLGESQTEVNLHVKPDGFYNVGPDDFVHNGIEIGRLRITERIGQVFGPQLGRRIASALAQHNELNPPYSPLPALEKSRDELSYNSQSKNVFHKGWHGRILDPPSDFLLSAFPCPQEWGSYFPSREEVHILYHQYFVAVDPLAHIIHKPSFDLECCNHLASSQTMETAPAPLKALILSICLAAAVSLSPMQSRLELGIAKQNELVAKLKVATEDALINANHLKSIELQTLQAFTIYMIPQCRAEVSASHIVLVSALIQLAKRAHLHLQPQRSFISCIDRQVRRLLWHQICFLDLRTAEIFGSRPTILDNEFDTPLPLNVDDVALEASHHQPPFSDQWTDATFTLLRYECYRVHRLILQKRKEIESDMTDLDSVRHLVDQQKVEIEGKYLNHLDENIPIQQCAKVVGRLLTSKFNAILLPGQLQDDEVKSSQSEIHDTLIFSSLAICESAVILDNATHLAPWSWYSGAYQRYRTSIFLLLDVYCNPKMPRADRIGAVLDHVYGPPSVSSRERNRDVLKTLTRNLQGHLDARIVQPLEFPAENIAIANVMEIPPNFSTIDPSQRINVWQAEMGYRHNYGQDIIPYGGEDWSNYPIQYTLPEHSMRSQMWTDEFEVNTGMNWSA